MPKNNEGSVMIRKTAKTFVYLVLISIAPGLSALPLFAENHFSLRLWPEVSIPPNTDLFDPAPGGGASFDWITGMPLKWLPYAGLSVSGGFSGAGVKDGTSLSLLSFGLGPAAQWQLGDRFNLRLDAAAGGYRYLWKEEENVLFQFSTNLSGSFQISPIFSVFVQAGYRHYQLRQQPLFNGPVFAAGVSVDFSEVFGSRKFIRAEKTGQNQIFPINYAWYEKNPVASLVITNEGARSITDLRASFYMDRYMSQPTVFDEIPRLGSGQSDDIEVTALFNEVMLTLTENTTVNAVVRLNYNYLGSAREEDIPVRIPLFHRNAMSWDDDRRAASFVSPKDPSAMLFARFTESVTDYLAAHPSMLGGLSEQRRDRDGIGYVPANIFKALGLFEALAVYGINYVVDPATPYIQLSEDSSLPDSLNYPYQTLHYRSGDCDDLSILFCSMLEVLNIDTAFITIPNHIYMAFDTGLKTGESAPMFPAARLIEWDGRYWMPVEITITSQGFARAWQTGMREWEGAGAGSRSFLPMAESWRQFPPVSVPGAGSLLPDLPDEARLEKMILEELSRLK